MMISVIRIVTIWMIIAHKIGPIWSIKITAETADGVCWREDDFLELSPWGELRSLN